MLPNSTIDHELDAIEDVIGLDDSPQVSNRKKELNEKDYKLNLRNKLLSSNKFNVRSSSQTLARDNTPSMSDLRVEKSPIRQKLK